MYGGARPRYLQYVNARGFKLLVPPRVQLLAHALLLNDSHILQCILHALTSNTHSSASADMNMNMIMIMNMNMNCSRRRDGRWTSAGGSVPLATLSPCFVGSARSLSL